MQIAHFVNTGPDLQYKFSQDSLAGKIQNISHADIMLQSHVLVKCSQSEKWITRPMQLVSIMKATKMQPKILSHKISANMLLNINGYVHLPTTGTKDAVSF